MKAIYLACSLFGLFISASAFAEKPDGSVYLDGGDSTFGLILAHGKGNTQHGLWLILCAKGYTRSLAITRFLFKCLRDTAIGRITQMGFLKLTKLSKKPLHT